MQVLPLRIGLGLQARAAARVRLAREQRLRESLRTAERVGALHEFHHRLGLEFEGAVHDTVVARDDRAEVAVISRQAQAPGHRLDESDAAFLVSRVARPLLARRRALAEIMHQRGESNLRFRGQQSRLIEHHQRVQAGVDFRVPLLGLRHAE